jgi:hypothetical protein
MQSLLVDPKITVLLAAQVKLVIRREIISGGSRRHQPSRVCHIVNPVGLPAAYVSLTKPTDDTTDGFILAHIRAGPKNVRSFRLQNE